MKKKSILISLILIIIIVFVTKILSPTGYSLLDLFYGEGKTTTPDPQRTCEQLSLDNVEINFQDNLVDCSEFLSAKTPNIIQIQLVGRLKSNGGNGLFCIISYTNKQGISKCIYNFDQNGAYYNQQSDCKNLKNLQEAVNNCKKLKKWRRDNLIKNYQKYFETFEKIKSSICDCERGKLKNPKEGIGDVDIKNADVGIKFKRCKGYFYSGVNPLNEIGIEGSSKDLIANFYELTQTTLLRIMPSFCIIHTQMIPLGVRCYGSICPYALGDEIPTCCQRSGSLFGEECLMTNSWGDCFRKGGIPMNGQCDKITGRCQKKPFNKNNLAKNNTKIKNKF